MIVRLMARLLTILTALTVSGCALLAPAPTIRQFSVTPNPIDRGDTLTIAWAVEGALRVELRRLSYDTNFGDPWLRPAVATVPDLPGTGSWTFEVPRDYRWPLRFEIEAVNLTGAVTALRSDVIGLRAYPCFFAPEDSCAAAPTAAPITWQPFERGHLMHVADPAAADDGTIYLLHEVWWQAFAAPTASAVEASTETPPDRLFAPQGLLGALWGTDDSVRAALGWATGPAESGSGQIQHAIRTEGMFDFFVIDGPRGRARLIGNPWDEAGPSWRLLDE
ncbi:MAG: hypothetical protein GYB67_19620 [Chloroflexi bacterium]|nr:hypothetical protein [Chloroflexota bacterium]